MKTTIRLLDLINSELKKIGKNEFFNNNQLSFYNDDFAFIKKELFYDNDVKSIVNKKFFGGLTLSDNEQDDEFKRMFVSKFLTAEINGQTMEDFSSRVISTFLSQKRFIENVYENLEKFMNGETTGEGKNTSKTLADFRNLMSTLPQDNINLNVDNTVLNYGDSNTINRSKNETTGTNNTKNNAYNIDTLLKTQDIFERILDFFDKKCFLQTW